MKFFFSSRFVDIVMSESTLRGLDKDDDSELHFSLSISDQNHILDCADVKDEKKIQTQLP